MPPVYPAACLLDLDGTLYEGDAAVPGAVAAVASLRARQIPFRCVTNTTSRSRAMIVARLARYGFDVAAEELVTATLAGVALARKEGYRRVAPFLPGPALVDLDGLALTGGTSGAPGGAPDAIVVGDLGGGWNFALMQEAFGYLMSGAGFIACSRDRYWRRGTELALDCGAFVAGLEYASGRTALVAGKPSAAFFHAACGQLGLPPAEVVMIGDDLWSDVAGAQAAGLRGWLVRTGKFRADALAEAGVSPDRVIDSVADLTA